MEVGRQKQIPIVCRFVCYDQWFITHIDPRWKIKNLKQIILAKCLNLSFDPRKLARETTDIRPPSPITFAPEETQRPDSPIQFASVRKKHSVPGNGSAHGDGSGLEEGGVLEEGYEEDDEWDDDEDGTSLRRSPSIMGGKVELPPPSPIVGNLPGAYASLGGMTRGPTDFASTLLPHEMPKDINTTGYTLVRFSTTQIMEDDFVIEWYDMLPHELVELHASIAPTSFSASVMLPRLLLDSKWNPSGTTNTNKSGASGKYGQHQSHGLNFSTKAKPGTTLEPTFISECITLTALPRNDLQLYIEPYWEGWVRALRVVFEGPDIPRAGASSRHNSYQDYAAGMTNFSGSMGGAMGMWSAEPKLLPDSPAPGKTFSSTSARYDNQKRKLEWKERWVFIKGGVIHMCKTRDDKLPTHRLPLSSLKALRDASHLGASSSVRPGLKDTSARPRNTTSRTGDRDEKRSHRRSMSLPRSSTSTGTVTARNSRRHDEDNVIITPPRSETLSAVDAKNLTRHGSQPHIWMGPSRVPSSASLGPVPRPRIENPDRLRVEEGLQRERERREMEMERVLEVERHKRKVAEQEFRDMAHLASWDEISFNWGKKSKEKEKEKEKARQKERQRAMERARDKERFHDSSSRGSHHDQDRRRHQQKQSRRRNPATYIPYSREEAEEAGMRVVCLKFKSPSDDVPQSVVYRHSTHSQDTNSVNGVPYTSTGPSLAAETSVTSDTEYNRRTDKTYTIPEEPTHHLHAAHSQPQLTAGRKASFPSLGLGKLGASSTLSPTIGHPNVPVINAGSTSGGTKFGISGFFGKDRGGASDREVDKEERKKEERERKLKEKEREKKSKDKSKKKEDTGEEDEGGGGGRSWLGMKRKPKDTDHLSPSAFNSTSTLLNASSQEAFRSTSMSTSANRSVSTLVPREDDEAHSRQASAGHTSDASRPSVSGPSRQNSAGSSNAPGENTNTGNGSDSDSSDLSLSSPVFAHSSDSDRKNQLDFERRERRGYRYGGYSEQKPVKPKAPATEGETEPDITDRTRERSGTITDPRREPPGQRTPKGKEKENPNPSPAKPSVSQEEILRRRRYEERKKRDEGRAEWMVLDLGCDHAYHSILRVFHRYFEEPETSHFIPASQRGLYPSANPLPRAASLTDSTAAATKLPESGASSALNSPTRNDFLSTSEGTPAAAAVPSIALPRSSQSDPDAEDDDMYVDSDADKRECPPQQPNEPKPPSPPAIHPAIFARVKPKKPQSTDPALKYPEWRTEVVQRATMHGMREANRPLDVVLNGWRGEFEESELESKLYRKRMMKDEEGRKSLRQSFIGGSEQVLDFADVEERAADDASAPPPANSGGGGGGADEKCDEDEADDAQEITKDDNLEDEEKRKQSLCESTQNGTQMTADARATDDHSVHYHGTSILEDNNNNNDDNAWTESGSVVEVFKDDEYAPDDADDDDVGELDMDSFDDTDEESETEWIAWVTDLPRQARVRQEQRQRERERMRAEALARRQQQQAQLSPMVFSDPHSNSPSSPYMHGSPQLLQQGDGIASRSSIYVGAGGSSLSLHLSLQQQQLLTPTEERKMFQEERRKFEPVAISHPPPPAPSAWVTSTISSPSISTLQSSAVSSRPAQTVVYVRRQTVITDVEYNTLLLTQTGAGSNAMASTSSLLQATTATPTTPTRTQSRPNLHPSQLHQRPVHQPRYHQQQQHLQHMPSQTTLSSPSSSESLISSAHAAGAAASGSASASRQTSYSYSQHSNPISPLAGQSPIEANYHSVSDDNNEDFEEDDAGGAQYASVGASGAGGAASGGGEGGFHRPQGTRHRLQHSTSMPLASIRAGNFGSSSPGSPSGSPSASSGSRAPGGRIIPAHSVPSSPPLSPGVSRHAAGSNTSYETNSNRNSKTSTVTSPTPTSTVSTTATSPTQKPNNTRPPGGYLIDTPILSPERIAQLEAEAAAGVPYSFPKYPNPSLRLTGASAAAAAAATSASTSANTNLASRSPVASGSGSKKGVMPPAVQLLAVKHSPERERGILRKKLSGLGGGGGDSSAVKTGAGGGNNAELLGTSSSPPGTTRSMPGSTTGTTTTTATNRSRPKLSLYGLGASSTAAAAASVSGSGSAEVHSPTQTKSQQTQYRNRISQGLRSPTLMSGGGMGLSAQHNSNNNINNSNSNSTSTSANSVSGSGGGYMAVNSASSSSSTTSATGVLPPLLPTQQQQQQQTHQPQPSSGTSTMAALLRRVRSGSSLRLDRHAAAAAASANMMEDGGGWNSTSPPMPLSPIASTGGRSFSPPVPSGVRSLSPPSVDRDGGGSRDGQNQGSRDVSASSQGAAAAAGGGGGKKLKKGALDSWRKG